jgi:ribosomal RNA assembly protein
MVRIIPVEHLAKVKKAVPVIENKIKINFSFGKDRVTITGNEVNEFLVEKIVQAVDFGFDVEDALLLTNEDFVLETINIKEHTRRKNLKEVRARVIGTSGKAKKTIENLTGSVIVIQGNMVGVIVDTEHLDAIVQAIESLIQGAKHGNVFAYLEKQNLSRRMLNGEDLGLKEGVLKGE